MSNPAAALLATPAAANEAPVSIAAADAVILVEIAGRAVALRRNFIVGLVEDVPLAPVPRAPAGFLGVAVLRGRAVPVLSLAALIGARQRPNPAAFAAIELSGRRALFAVDRIVGLRAATGLPLFEGDDAGGSAPIDLSALLEGELRRIVLGFPAAAAARASPDRTAAYLAFTAGGQDCALPIACVERVLDARPMIRLPRRRGADAPRVDTAIEARGRIVPVVLLGTRLCLPVRNNRDDGTAGLRPAAGGTPAVRDERGASIPAPGAFVLLRASAGAGAIGVDRILGLVRLRPEDIVSPPPDAGDLIAGVAAPAQGGGVLRILAPDRLWARQ